MYVHPVYHWPPKSRWAHKRQASRRWQTFSAYVHFPYCRHICDYCGYETRLIDKVSVAKYEEFAVQEILRVAQRDDFDRSALRAVFFGGGTASLMPEKTLSSVLAALRTIASQATVPEVTLECEPGTISRRKLELAREAGVNRISVRAQSLNDEELVRITRRHSAKDALTLIDDCRASGLENLHVDLMYGLPGQSLGDWRRTVEHVASLGLKHISAYKLFVFKHGTLHRDGTAPRPEDEEAEFTRQLQRMHDLAVRSFEEAGYRQYSLTEFALPGYECQYITDCFGAGDLLPIGPSSFGRNGLEVWENPTFVSLYGDTQQWEDQRRTFLMDPLEELKRDVILGLWLLDVNVEALAAKRAVTLSERFLETLESLSREDRVNQSSGVLQLAHHQRFHAGVVMDRLARLPSAEWGAIERSDVAISVSTPAEQGDSDLRVNSAESNTIIRTARRDPRFFDLLRADPQSTLQAVGAALPEDEKSNLLAAIRDQNPSAPSEAQKRLRLIWLKVVEEHGARRSSAE